MDNPPERLLNTLDRLVDVLQDMRRTLDVISLNPHRYERRSRLAEVSQTISAGDKKKLFSFGRPGGLVDHIYLYVNQSDCTIILRIDSDEIVITPSQMSDRYLLGENPRTMYLVEYDATAGSYRIMFTPTPLRVFEETFEMELIASASNAVAYQVDVVHYEDKLG